MVQKALNEMTTDRDGDGEKGSNKGCWGTRTPATAGSHCYLLSQGGRSVTGAHWKSETRERDHGAGAMIVEGTATVNYSDSEEGGRWEEIYRSPFLHPLTSCRNYKLVTSNQKTTSQRTRVMQFREASFHRSGWEGERGDLRWGVNEEWHTKRKNNFQMHVKV